MSTSKWLMVAPLAGALGIGAGIGADKLLGAAAPGEAKQDVKQAVTLPITRVVLFNSGVGYFSRSGEVTDDARVDLTFPEQDVNDLLKSMVLEDFNNGRIAAVNYDSREPIARTLSSFAVNLNGNPTFAGIVSQMRGERVDVVINPGATNQPGKLSGVIVGVETQKVAAGNGPATVDVEILNMWCAEGLRSVKLPDVQQLKFANPVVESEFRRALDVLALSHDSQKKSVSSALRGRGQAEGAGRVRDRGPDLEDELPAGARREGEAVSPGLGDGREPDGRGLGRGEDGAHLGPADLLQDGPLQPALRRSADGRAGAVRVAATRHLPRRVREGSARSKDLGMSDLARTRTRGRACMSAPSEDGVRLPDGRRRRRDAAGQTSRYACEAEAERRRCARRVRSEAERPERPMRTREETAAELGRRLGTGSVGNAATAGALGDFFQYTIDHPVSLARQKSAMLPIVGKDIEGQKVSHLQPVRAGEAPAPRAEVQEHLGRAPEPGTDHRVRGERLRRRHPRARRPAERGTNRLLRHRPRAPKSIRRSAPAPRRSPA